MRKTATDTVTCHVDGEKFGEYVTAGDTYTITYPHTRRGQVHFWNNASQCGTFMAVHAFMAAVAAGYVEILAP